MLAILIVNVAAVGHGHKLGNVTKKTNLEISIAASGLNVVDE